MKIQLISKSDLLRALVFSGLFGCCFSFLWVGFNLLSVVSKDQFASPTRTLVSMGVFGFWALLLWAIPMKYYPLTLFSEVEEKG